MHRFIVLCNEGTLSQCEVTINVSFSKKIELQLFMKKRKYISFGNKLDFKYQYNLAFYICTGKLLYVPLCNFYGWEPQVQIQRKGTLSWKSKEKFLSRRPMRKTKMQYTLFQNFRMFLRLDHFRYVLFHYFSGKPMFQTKLVSQLNVGYSYQ